MITKQNDFDDRNVSTDGRLTEPSSGINNDIRSMLEKVKEVKKSPRNTLSDRRETLPTHNALRGVFLDKISQKKQVSQDDPETPADI